jgi:hypothetical protein
MPRNEFKPLLGKEQKFVFHFAREGFDEDKLNLVERACRLKTGEGRQMLRRGHVQKEINRRRIAIEFEENRLIAKDKARIADEDREAAIVTPRKLEAALSDLVDIPKNADAASLAIKQRAIELGLIYIGKIRDGNRIRMHELEAPKPQPTTTGETAPEKLEDGFYRSIFAGMEVSAAPGPAVQVAPVPLMPEGPPPEPVKPVLQVASPPFVPRPPAPPSSSTPKKKREVSFT